MAAMKTFFDYLIVPINPNAMMKTYVSSSNSFSSVVFSNSTDASTLSTVRGTIQPRFATGTAQGVTSHLIVTSHYFQQRFWSNIHDILQGQDSSLPSTAFQPILFVDADVEHSLVPLSKLEPEGKHGGYVT